MAKVYQIGTGMVGQAMALNLAKNHTVVLGGYLQSNHDIVNQNNPSIDLILDFF